MQPNRNTVVGAEPATIMKVQDVARMLSDGKTRATIIGILQEKYDIGYDQAKHLYCAGVKYLIPSNEDEFRKELIMKNISRLERIIEKAMDGEQLKVAREAIDSLNKMLGLNGGSSVTIAKNGEGDETIMITFDGR